MQFPEKPIVIGAGPAGLCVGWNLALDDIPVTILEKSGETGGLSLTFSNDGYLFDLGPHNIHTVYPDIVTFLKKILKDDLYQHNPNIKIFFREHLVSYPLKGVYVFRALPLRTIIPAGISFLWARLKMFLRDPKNDDSFESWIKNRFGGVLYKYYFGPYAQKVWKIESTYISKYVAEKRVPILSIRDYIGGIFKKRPSTFHSEDWTHISSYYPRKGVGQITNYLAKGIVDNSGIIENNVEVAKKFTQAKNIFYAMTFCLRDYEEVSGGKIISKHRLLNQKVRTEKLSYFQDKLKKPVIDIMDNNNDSIILELIEKMFS